jgi:fructose-1,6-bisphosphatase I
MHDGREHRPNRDGLVDGGIYFYPADPKNREGKLRLMYECLPLGFVTERAGGRASTGAGRILDLRPGSPHQRTPFAVGSPEDVALYEQFLEHGRPS